MELAGLNRNLPLKLLALLLALVVYAHVQTENEQEEEFRIPLRLTGLSNHLVLGTEAPRDAHVRIRGTGKQILKFKVHPPEVLVDLRETRPGRVQRMLSATDVILPVGSSAVVAEVLDPRMVEITVDTLIHKTLPVAPDWRGDPGSLYAVAGPLETDPPWVTVRGPSRVLETLSGIPTVPFDLAELRGSGGQAVALAPPPGVEALKIREVRVRGRLVPASNRVYAALPVRARGVPAAWIADFSPPRVEVLLAGAERALASIPPESLRVLALCEGLEPGRHLIALTVQVPLEPQVRLVRVRPAQVTLRLGPGLPEGVESGN